MCQSFKHEAFATQELPNLQYILSHALVKQHGIARQMNIKGIPVLLSLGSQNHSNHQGLHVHVHAHNIIVDILYGQDNRYYIHVVTIAYTIIYMYMYIGAYTCTLYIHVSKE